MTENRPLYISCVFWGEEFSYYYTEYFLATLIASKNLPAIKGVRECKLLVATTLDDFNKINELPITKEVEKYAELVFIEIPPCPPGVHGCNHMGVGHILATDMAFRDKAYLCALVPDMLMSNGTIEFINQKIEAGYSSVLCTCMRVEDIGFLASVRKFGRKRLNENISNGCTPLEISGRELVDATMNNLHSQSKAWEFGKSYFAGFPVAPFWVAEKNRSWIIHSLHWVPLMLDYSVVDNHDKSCLEQWTMDGDYLHDNFGGAKNSVYIVVDSDEAIVSSWSPKEDRAVSISESFKWIDKLPDYFFKTIKNYILLAYVTKSIEAIHKTYNNEIFDKTKKELFTIPIVWHIDGNSSISIDKVADITRIINGITKEDPNIIYDKLSKDYLKIDHQEYELHQKKIAFFQKRIAFYPLMLKKSFNLFLSLIDFIFILNKVSYKLKMVFYLFHGRYLQSKDLIKSGNYIILIEKMKIALKRDKHYLLRYKIFWYTNKMLWHLKNFSRK